MRILVLTCSVLWFALYCHTGQAESNGDTLVETWAKKMHPEILETLLNRLEKEKEKSDPRKYYDRNKNMLELIRMFISEHPKEVNAQMEKFLSKVSSKQGLQHHDHGEIMATEAPLTCASSVQCPPARKRTDLWGLWQDFTKSLKDDAASCEPCQLLLSGLQDMACEGPWEPSRDDLIVLCENLLFPLLDVDPIICNGTITLQGQHLYCIVREASTLEMCESLNMCYPTSEKLKPKARRMPWEVKDELQPKLQKKLKRQQKRRSKRQNNTIRLVQLSDIHIQTRYAIGAPSDCKAFVCCMENSIARDGSGYARKWGEYFCNLPERTMRLFLQRANSFNPDFVIYTGDSPPHNMWDETLTSQLNCSNIVVNAMKELLPQDTRVYPNIGNHEMYPTNLYSMRLPDTTYMNQLFTQMWHGLAGLDAQANATFSDMSYYTILHQPGLRILSINTNYDWYPLNFYNTLNKNDTVTEDQKRFVEDTLALARTNGEKVIILGHHPIGGSSAVIRTAAWWQTVANEYRDVIVLHVSGHTHNDHQHFVLDPTTDEATAVNLVTAITSTIMNVNPSLRVFELDSTTFELLNYQSYFFEISTQNPDAEPEIVLAYDAKVEYNMTDLSPAAWQDLVLRFMDDELLFQRWYSNKFGKAELGPCLFDDVCGESCKRTELCGIWFAREDEAANCVARWENATLSVPPVYDAATSAGYRIWVVVLLAVITRLWTM